MTNSLHGGAGVIYGKLNSAQVVVIKDYNLLNNKPSIEGTELKGNKTFAELGLTPMTSAQIDYIINNLT